MTRAPALRPGHLAQPNTALDARASRSWESASTIARRTELAGQDCEALVPCGIDGRGHTVEEAQSRAQPAQPDARLVQLLLCKPPVSQLRFETFKAQRETIPQFGGQVLERTREDVAPAELDERGRYRRIATSWGVLSCNVLPGSRGCHPTEPPQRWSSGPRSAPRGPASDRTTAPHQTRARRGYLLHVRTLGPPGTSVQGTTSRAPWQPEARPWAGPS